MTAYNAAKDLPFTDVYVDVTPYQGCLYWCESVSDLKNTQLLMSRVLICLVQHN